MVAQNNQPLVTVVVPVYNVEKFVPKCLDSILDQTYSNIEIIVVNDGSQGDINRIVSGYQINHNNIKLVDLGKNRGLFRARLEGFKSATGEYVVSVDGDDSISSDYIRSMVAHAERNESDIVMPETVIVNDNEKFIFNLANDLPFTTLEGQECLARFFEQEGNDYIWHRVAAPLYRSTIINLSIPFLDTIEEHIVMCEDVLFNVVFWNYARRIDRLTTAYYYYYQHENSSLATRRADLMRSKLSNINTVFDRVTGFLKKQNIFVTYKKSLTSWMNLYAFDYHNQIDGLPEDETVKRVLHDLIRFGDTEWSKSEHSQFYKTTTSFNEGLDKIKQKINDSKVEYVSFDIFDTLLTRPFLQPSDLFYLLGSDFSRLDGKFRLESFHNIRIKSEEIARFQENDLEDVSLAQIYSVMQKEYSVEKTVAEKMLNAELGYEMRFCQQRKTAKELYDLALYVGKKVIITSDMYLPRDTIKTILRECGYVGYNKLYISSHHGTMKATQNLYKHITKELKVSPDNVVHIGDNYESDVVAANAAGWCGLYFPKTTSVVPDIFDRIFREDGYYARSHLGVSTAYALTMNKFFDNPFKSFLGESNYNSSPYSMGYFALGLSMLGFTKWMIDDAQEKNIDSIVFLSRDGYLPKQIYDIFQEKLKLTIRSHYLPTSRKAVIPLALFGKANLAEIKTFNYRGRITDSILAVLKDFQTVSVTDSSKLDIDFAKISKLQKAFVKTYSKYFKGNTAIMDIGYSGRPEQVFSELFHTPIETYFIYTGNDEAERRLGKKVNVYDRLHVASLREKIISELGPSCTGYKLLKDTVEPNYSETTDIPYFERYVLTDLQRGAKDFVVDYLEFFHEHLSVMAMGDNRLAMQPLDNATIFPNYIDRELFRNLVHEDDIAGQSAMKLFDEYYSSISEIDQLRAENQNAKAELQSRMSIRRSGKLFIGNIKRRIIYGKER